MSGFDAFWANTVSLIWGPALVILLTGSGIYFTLTSRLIFLRGFLHAIDIIRGRFDNPDDPGEITHFQALSSALSATIGLGNIAGVAIAIGIGGPGAIFWMWLSGLVGMSTKFFTCTLACMYRKTDDQGIVQGGPMYFLEAGLGKNFKPLAIMFSLFGMIGTLGMFQSNQLSQLLHRSWEIPPVISGILAMVFVGAVILGGIRRVGLITSKLVPAMCLLYLVSCLYIILSNYSEIPQIFLSIFQQAFGTESVLGGAAGLTIREVMTTGIQRAAFSNEAGIGTAALAHGAAKTSEPVREGLVAMLGPFIDTHVICTITALVILITGVSSDQGGILMTAEAFESVFPVVGNALLTLIVTLFALSTMVAYSYYGVKCAKYVFGSKIGQHYIYVYLLLLPAGAIWKQGTVLNIIDSAFALMAIPTLTGALLLSRKVMVEFNNYRVRNPF